MAELSMSIHNFIYVTYKKYLQIQKIEEGSERAESIKHYMKLSDEGAICMVCGCAPIWVAVSADVGWCGCFTCITGETDASNDYDVVTAWAEHFLKED